MKRLQGGEHGATAVEYGVLIALIAAVIISAVALLGGTTSDAYNAYCKAMAAAGNPC